MHTNSAEHSPPTSRGSWIAILISTLISVGTIVLLFQEVNFDEFTQQLRDADYRYILALLLAYPPAMTIRALRWQELLKSNIEYWRGFHIINLGFLFNTVLPFRIGEFTRILLVSREPKLNMGAGLSAVTVERLFDLMMALLAIGMGLVLLPEEASLPENTTSTMGILAIFTFIGMFVVIFLPRSHTLLLSVADFCLQPLPETLREKLLGFATDTLHNLESIAEPKRLIKVLGYSILTWIAYFAFFQVGLYSFFEVAPPLGVGMLVLGFVAIGIAVPSLPGAIGVFQAAAVLALSTAGYETEVATGYAWVLWITQTIVIILGGVIGLWAMSLTFGDVTNDVRANMDGAEAEEF